MYSAEISNVDRKIQSEKYCQSTVSTSIAKRLINDTVQPNENEYPQQMLVQPLEVKIHSLIYISSNTYT